MRRRIHYKAMQGYLLASNTGANVTTPAYMPFVRQYSLVVAITYLCHIFTLANGYFFHPIASYLLYVKFDASKTYGYSLNSLICFYGYPLIFVVRFQPLQILLLIFQTRSEEHTSELQSPKDLVCRLLL